MVSRHFFNKKSMNSRALFIGILVFSLLLINACRTINVTYKPNEWQQGFAMDIPPYKRMGYINGGTDWIYIFKFKNERKANGKCLFIAYPYGSISPYPILLNNLIEKQYGDSLFDYQICDDGHVYKQLKTMCFPKYTWSYSCKNGEIKSFSREGNPNNLFYEKLFYEKVGLHYDIYNIDLSSLRPLYTADTVIYTGVDSNLAWKSIEIVGTIMVGYINVPLKEKRKFDRCLSTIHAIDSISLEVDDFVKQILRVE